MLAGNADMTREYNAWVRIEVECFKDVCPCIKLLLFLQLYLHSFSNIFHTRRKALNGLICVDVKKLLTLTPAAAYTVGCIRSVGYCVT